MNTHIQLGMLGEPDLPAAEVNQRALFAEWGGGYAAEPGSWPDEGPWWWECSECIMCVGKYTRTGIRFFKCHQMEHLWDGSAKTDIDPCSPACERAWFSD